MRYFFFVVFVCFASDIAYSQDLQNSEVSMMDYLAGNPTRKALEFTEKQNNEFRKMQIEYSAAWRKLYADFPELKNSNIPEKAREELNRKIQIEVQKLRKEFGKKAKELLVPRQFELISSLKFKQTSETFGFAYTVSNAPYANKLKMTAQQKKELASIHQETQKDIQKKIEELKAAGKRKMMKVLDAKQRKILKEIEGDIKK